MSDRLRQCASCKAYTLSSVPVDGAISEDCPVCYTHNKGSEDEFPLMDSAPVTPAESGRWVQDGCYIDGQGCSRLACSDSDTAADIARRLNALGAAQDALERMAGLEEHLGSMDTSMMRQALFLASQSARAALAAAESK